MCDSSFYYAPGPNPPISPKANPMAGRQQD